MRIVIQITVDDLAAAAHQHVVRSSSIKSMKRRGMTAIGVGTMAAAGLGVVLTKQIWMLGAGAIVATLFMALHSWRFRHAYVENSKKVYLEHGGKGILGKKELRIDDAGLYMRSKYAEAIYYWHGIESISETDAHYLVALTGFATAVIPKARVLEGDVDAFMTEVEKRWLAARDNANPE